MGIVRGMKAIDAVISGQGAGSGEKVTWLKMEDKQAGRLRFMNELDEDSPNYDPTWGTAIVVGEHSNPKDYKRKAVCTEDTEGRCFGCEQHRKDYKAKWGPKQRYYTNVLFDAGDGNPIVAVWSQGIFKNNTFAAIKEYFLDTNSLTNLTWKIKREGLSTETTYVLFPGQPDDKPFDKTGLVPFDLDKVVKQIPYAEQEAFYMGVNGGAAVETTTTNIDW